MMGCDGKYKDAHSSGNDKSYNAGQVTLQGCLCFFLHRHTPSDFAYYGSYYIKKWQKFYRMRIENLTKRAKNVSRRENRKKKIQEEKNLKNKEKVLARTRKL